MGNETSAPGQQPYEGRDVNKQFTTSNAAKLKRSTPTSTSGTLTKQKLPPQLNQQQQHGAPSAEEQRLGHNSHHYPSSSLPDSNENQSRQNQLPLRNQGTKIKEFFHRGLPSPNSEGGQSTFDDHYSHGNGGSGSANGGYNGGSSNRQNGANKLLQQAKQSAKQKTQKLQLGTQKLQQKIKESRALKQQQQQVAAMQQQQQQQQQDYGHPNMGMSPRKSQQQQQHHHHHHQQQIHPQQHTYRPSMVPKTTNQYMRHELSHYKDNGQHSRSHPHSHEEDVWYRQQQQQQYHKQHVQYRNSIGQNHHQHPPPHYSNSPAMSHMPTPPPSQQHQHQQPMMNFMYAQQSKTPTRTPMSPRTKMKQLADRVGGISITCNNNKTDEIQWEENWDEDDDDDEDDDNESEIGGSIGATMGMGMGMGMGPTHPHSPPRYPTPHGQATPSAPTNPMLNNVVMRPTMDGAHSSSSPVSMQYQHPYYHQQQHNSHLSRTHLFNNDQKIPTGAVAGPSSPTSMINPADKILTARCDMVLQEGANGIRWDTTLENQGGYEKPSLINFLPLLRVLGKGSFGKVVLVQKRTGHEKGGLFAMKILKKTHLLKRGQIERTRTERKVLSVVDHPFIMKLHFAFQTDEKLFLILDYCAGGELFFHLSRHQRFPEKWTRLYAAELLLALGYLHSKGIIYRDLKPENVLLDSEGHVKLGDFGLAKANIKHACKGAASMCGTPEYMSPEVLMGLGHGFCVDYWGLGMLTYEMMTGLPPWYTTDREKLYQRLRSAPLVIPSFFSPQVSDCIAGLLQRDPRRRLGVRGKRSVMAHDFFRGLDFREVISRRVQAPIPPCEGWKAIEGEDDGEEGRRQPFQSEELNEATKNFDPTFTRLSVHSVVGSEDAGNNSESELEGEELNEHTFVGFTFDEDDGGRKSATTTGKRS